MSDSDSFIDEVTEEVRRDRLFLLLRRWGWIGALLIVAVVGGAAWKEYRKAQEAARSQALGDGIIAALAADDAAARAEALEQLSADSTGGQAVLRMMTAGALTEAGRTDAAVAALQAVAGDGELPQVYRQIAGFKALTLQGDTLPVADRRLQFEALTAPGAPLRLLAEEQLALIDIEEGETDAAISRLRAMVQDAEAGPDLQQRATQLIVALGGSLETQPGQNG
ncbi:hypothetical protein SAMN05444007_10364 [Cribrihabitans marinus]|uniref:Tetratricopeptide repeat-like domain-containing protein n=1 Tax=Cribrihabitans marinus TaxID=1227549 RepID=A0A1H6V0U7_9RHOB|nr:hypothetical protein [Cribrihabitans marinus]GGH26523.1 hypothetical protein GCM10010973_14330 [Cribrihabitans marinus]SEI98209.1 hypothetical protein SAMN05444007_10364 [Cribrihabitans marinus]